MPYSRNGIFRHGVFHDLHAPSIPSTGRRGGKKAFVFYQSCHVAGKDINKKSGPSLYGGVGRTAGTHPGYAFSKAMIAAGKSGVVWDEPTLATFLRRPS
jgi:cytochrome c